MKIHSKEKLYSCEVCHKLLGSLRSLNKHGRMHTEEKPFKCEFCSKAFAHVANLDNHARIHTGEKPFKCKFCHKAFAQVANLNHHVRIHTGEKPYKCQLCTKAFVQITQLNNHNRTHTGEKPFKCQFCGKAFTQVANLNSHVRTHPKEEPSKYDFQDKVIDQLSHFNVNCAIQSIKQLKICQFCDEVFKNARDLRKHRRNHAAEKASMSMHIENSTEQSLQEVSLLSDNFLNHGKKCHGSTLPNDNCLDRKETPDVEYWESEMAIQGKSGNLANEDLFNVDLQFFNDCLKASAESSSLKKHKKTKSKEKLYSCGVCHRRFRSIRSVNQHGRIHTGEKSFKGTFCGKAFTQVANLNNHLRIHPRVEPSKYDLYDNAIDQLGYLNMNCTVQTIEQLNICEVCDKVFQYDCDLREHKRTHAAEKAAMSKQNENSTEQVSQDAGLLLYDLLNNETKCQGGTLHNDHCLNRKETLYVEYKESEMGIHSKSGQPTNEKDVNKFVVRPFGCGICNEMFGYEESFVLHCKHCDAPVKDILGEQFERHLLNLVRR